MNNKVFVQGKCFLTLRKPMDNFEQVRIYLPSLSCHYAHQLVASNFSFYLYPWLYYAYARRSLTSLHGWTTYISHADTHAKTSQLIRKNERSIPYIICWTLVSQSFMQLTHGSEHANWPQSQLILASLSVEGGGQAWDITEREAERCSRRYR